jgi:hypothetical protein
MPANRVETLLHPSHDGASSAIQTRLRDCKCSRSNKTVAMLEKHFDKTIPQTVTCSMTPFEIKAANALVDLHTWGHQEQKNLKKKRFSFGVLLAGVAAQCFWFIGAVVKNEVGDSTGRTGTATI